MSSDEERHFHRHSLAPGEETEGRAVGGALLAQDGHTQGTSTVPSQQLVVNLPVTDFQGRRPLLHSHRPSHPRGSWQIAEPLLGEAEGEPDPLSDVAINGQPAAKASCLT